MIKEYFIGLGIFLCGASSGYFLLPNENTNVTVIDLGTKEKKRDGSIDIIVDENWKIICTKDKKVLPITTGKLNDYWIGEFTTDIPVTVDKKYFWKRARPALEECLPLYKVP